MSIREKILTFADLFKDQRPQRIRDESANEALERAARYCDGQAALYPRTDVGFDTGYRMAAERAARDIRKMKG